MVTLNSIIICWTVIVSNIYFLSQTMFFNWLLKDWNSIRSFHGSWWCFVVRHTNMIYFPILISWCWLFLVPMSTTLAEFSLNTAVTISFNDWCPIFYQVPSTETWQAEISLILLALEIVSLVSLAAVDILTEATSL